MALNKTTMVRDYCAKLLRNDLNRLRVWLSMTDNQEAVNALQYPSPQFTEVQANLLDVLMEHLGAAPAGDKSDPRFSKNRRAAMKS